MGLDVKTLIELGQKYEKSPAFRKTARLAARSRESSPHNQPSQVDHPAHYNQGKIEVIEFIEDQNLGYHLGNALKYIARSGKKNTDKTREDIEKAVWYLKRWLELDRARANSTTPKRPNEMNPYNDNGRPRPRRPGRPS